jgi:general secretion pathway protein A
VTTQLAADDLLRKVGFMFGVKTPGREKSTILQELSTKFLELRNSGQRALLIVDEAQDHSSRAMEELRLLTNLQEDGQPLLQIFLLGQPELRELVRDKELEPLYQRIIAASHLKALEEHETRAYVEHRLRVVGWKNDPLISDSVYPIIHLFSEGVPRRINLMCNRLFLHSFVEHSKRIVVEHARTVIEELQDEQLARRNLLNDSMLLAQDTFDGQNEEEEPAQSSASPDVRGQKAQFQVQEISPPTFSRVGENTEEKEGLERRLDNRRSSLERREEIRFEVNKEDRRKNHGRRHDDNSPDFWQINQSLLWPSTESMPGLAPRKTKACNFFFCHSQLV